MADFRTVIMQLESYGFMDVLLPFLLIFVVVFAILQKIKPFGEDAPRQKGYNIIIALVMALAVVIPHVMGYYPADADIVVIINKALPQVSIILVAVLMVILIVGLFGGKPEWGSSLSGWVAFCAFLIVGFIFARAAGWFTYLPNWLYWLDNPDTQAMLLIIAVFAIVIWFITKEPTPEGKTGETLSKFGKSWSDLFGGAGGGKK
ncbi:TPA: hypothetical protein HA265_07945 [Candidatus Woesearchaeota archaeon]|nr:hypothetical protein [Candidatus Woesearchaeota archaeon]